MWAGVTHVREAARETERTRVTWTARANQGAARLLAGNLRRKEAASRRDAYFAPLAAAYFLRNLSTRPAVSTIFCLPV
jgi:hypothetical protein